MGTFESSFDALESASGGAGGGDFSRWVTPDDCTLVTAGAHTIDTALNAVGDELSIGITQGSGGRTDALDRALIYSIDISSLLSEYNANAEQAIYVDLRPSSFGKDSHIVVGPHYTNGGTEEGFCGGPTLFQTNYYAMAIDNTGTGLYSSSAGSTNLSSFFPIVISNRGNWSGVIDVLTSVYATNRRQVSGGYDFGSNTSQIVFALGFLGNTTGVEETFTWKMRFSLSGA
jgi:hypothetical protein